jgi:hypothetical protein
VKLKEARADLALAEDSEGFHAYCDCH